MMSLTLNGQTSSDSVTITRNQQKQCLKWYYDNQFKDSIIIYKDSIIIRQTDFIELSSERIERLDSSLTESKHNLERMKKKRNRAFIIGGVSTIVSFVFGLFII